MRYFIVLIFLFAFTKSVAQKIEIDWIELAGNKVIVHYKLDDTNTNHQYLISLFSSADNFTTSLTKVAGDVGTEVKAGVDKKITWDITKELPSFKGNLTFEVRGRVFISYVKLTSFSEGLVFKRGKNTPLNWTSGNLSGQVNIELFKSQERIPVENNAPNSGRYDWHIPGNLKKGSDYKLRFTNSKDRDDFIESPSFSIKPKVPVALKIAGAAILVGGLVFIAGSGGESGTVTPPAPESSLPGNPGKPN